MARLLGITTMLLSLAAPLAAEDVGASADTAGLTQKEIADGFRAIFDGRTLDGWVGVAGSTDSYYVKDGLLICKEQGRDHVFTEKEYSDFVLRLEIKIPPGGNNGVGIRADISREPHLYGMEIQVLDNSAPKHQDLKPYQYHGSIYGVVPAKRGFLKPPGQWNREEIVCNGRRVKVTLNGTVIVDADLDKIGPKTMDGKDHPGLKYTKGRIGLHAHGYGEEVFFRNIRVSTKKGPGVFLDTEPAPQ